MKTCSTLDGLYYEIQGSGDTLIFLHGIGGTHQMFAPQVEALSHHFQTLTVDLLGSGRSKSVIERSYLDAHLKSIRFLMQQLKIGQAIFVGLSYGGIVAQAFAIRHPEKVKKMVLIDTYANVF